MFENNSKKIEIYMGHPILIGIPHRLDYKMDARITTAIELWDREDDKESYYAPTSSPTLGRDCIVQYAKYRVPHPSHILFIDSDVLPRRNTLEALLKHDKDIITGVVPILQKRQLLWNVSKEETWTPLELNELPDNPFKVALCGFGIVLVKYEVFDKLEWPYWKDEFAPGRRTLGQDMYFCNKAVAAGFDIWCDPKVKCDHIRTTGLLHFAKLLMIKEKQNA